MNYYKVIIIMIERTVCLIHFGASLQINIINYNINNNNNYYSPTCLTCVSFPF